MRLLDRLRGRVEPVRLDDDGDEQRWGLVRGLRETLVTDETGRVRRYRSPAQAMTTYWTFLAPKEEARLQVNGDPGDLCRGPGAIRRSVSDLRYHTHVGLEIRRPPEMPDDVFDSLLWWIDEEGAIGSSRSYHHDGSCSITVAQSLSHLLATFSARHIQAGLGGVQPGTARILEPWAEALRTLVDPGVEPDDDDVRRATHTLGRLSPGLALDVLRDDPWSRTAPVRREDLLELLQAEDPALRREALGLFGEVGDSRTSPPSVRRPA